jgi:ABC-type phosphate transport system substrate-binding protein
VITNLKEVTCGGNSLLSSDTLLIQGSGGTFPAELYSEWTYLYQFVDPSVVITYDPVGSGAGQKALIQRSTFFAGKIKNFHHFI